MGTNCTDVEDLPYSYEVYKELTTRQIVMYIIATVLAIVSVIMFFESVHYVRKKIPVKVRRNRHIWILGIFPMFSVTSLLGLLMTRATLLTMFAASVYFSVCIYQFLLLIIDYYGGANAMILVMKDKDVKVNVPPVLCCCVCIPTIHVTRESQPWLRRAVLQVAMVSPFSLFISAVLWADGRYLPGDVSSLPSIWLSMITILSTVTAMQALGIVFQSSKVTLKEYKLTSKYMIIQLTMIFSNVQLSLLNLLSSLGVIECTGVFSSLGQTYYIYNFLVVCEFFALGILARVYFRSQKMGNLDQIIDTDKTTDLKEVYENSSAFDGNDEDGQKNATKETLKENTRSCFDSNDALTTDKIRIVENTSEKDPVVMKDDISTPNTHIGTDKEGSTTQLINNESRITYL